jgi:hypothetical protein
MRYLLLIRPDVSELPVGWGPDPRLEEEMGALLEEMTKAGVLLDTAGLRPPEEGAVLRLAGGDVTVLDGPYTESKEVVGGYCLRAFWATSGRRRMSPRRRTSPPSSSGRMTVCPRIPVPGSW